MHKQINIFESYLTDEKVIKVYFYRPDQGTEGKIIPEWYFRTVQDIAEDTTFKSMVIQLEQSSTTGGLKREIEIRVFMI